MQAKLRIVLFVLMCWNPQAFSQSLQNEKVNTSGIESYFKIASLLQAGEDPRIIDWKQLFKTPAYQMMIMGGAMDTVALKSEMADAYSTSATKKEVLSPRALYHKVYKENQNRLEGYIQLLHTANVIDSIKSLLYPFLPGRLQTEKQFPTLFYVNYGAPEATGSAGFVISDLWHSYKIDTYKFGLLGAHEVFHAIVSLAFLNDLKEDLNRSSPDFNLFFFLQNINEEGIADLIDKPLLLLENSPLHEEVKKLTDHDKPASERCIKKLDSLLRLAFTSDTVLNSYKSFVTFADTFGKNGGHIPGRFMAMIIQEAELFPQHRLSIEDPVSFILTYNEAVQKLKKNHPVFSVESLSYLKRLKSKYFRK